MADAQNRQGLQELKIALREKKLRPLYIFYGQEQYLLRYYLEQIKKQRIEEVTESFNFHRLNSENFSVQEFCDSVENLPMMAQYTMVQVDDIDFFKLPEADREKLQSVFSDIPDYCTVVFTYETVAWKPDKRLKKLWDAVQSNASLVEFCKQDQRDLVSWITRHFAAEKKRISTDLCIYLIDITDGTLTTLGGEIRKICAYSGAQEIKKTDIDAVVEPVLDAVVFQMTELMAQGRYGQALEKLSGLFKLQQDPIYLLGAIGSHFRKLGTARTLLDEGEKPPALQKLYGMADYTARKTMDSARRFSPEFCRKAASWILETDRKMKTSYDDPQRLLELLILQLAQEARHG